MLGHVLGLKVRFNGGHDLNEARAALATYVDQGNRGRLFTLVPLLTQSVEFPTLGGPAASQNASVSSAPRISKATLVCSGCLSLPGGSQFQGTATLTKRGGPALPACRQTKPFQTC